MSSDVASTSENDTQKSFTEGHRTSLSGTAKQILRSRLFFSLLFGGLVGVLVIGPFYGSSGWPLLLDFASGPRATLPPEIWGLGSGISAGMPLAIVNDVVGHIVGLRLAAWLIAWAVFPIGVWSIARLMQRGRIATMGAGLLFVVNPFIFERLWAGQVGVLIGYAFLPALLASLRTTAGNTQETPPLRQPVLWMSVCAAFSVHYLWIGGLLIFGRVIAQRLSVKRLIWLLSVVVLIALCNAYIVPSLVGSTASTTVTTNDINAYATNSLPHVGIFGTLLGLYGFWRQEVPLPIHNNPLAYFFFGLIAVTAAIGIVQAIRQRNSSQQLVVASCIAGGVALFLAAGAQGPTGDLFRWMFNHVPGFNVMREPQKFVSLLALLYAYGFGLGVAQIVEAKSRTALIIGAGVALIVPTFYTPTIWWAYNDRLDTSSYPSDWYAARIAANGPGTTLFLPWHQYIGFNFTQGRHIATPAAAFFGADTISGDNVELPGLTSTSTSPRSEYIQRLIDDGASNTHLADDMTTLGVDYIVLAQAADSSTYGWLNNQSDIQRVYVGADVSVYKNTQYLGTGYVTHPDGTVTSNVIEQKSPHKYVVHASPPGVLTFTRALDSNWSFNGQHAQTNAAGVSVFNTDGDTGNIHYKRWSYVKRCEEISVLSLVLVTVYARAKLLLRRTKAA